MNQDAAWPALPYAEWAATRKTLHLVCQMVGKVRLALAPPQPEWLHTCLYLDGRGWTTGGIPAGTDLLAIGVDVFDCNVWLRLSDGRGETIPLLPDRPVAEIWSDLRATLARLRIPADPWDKPQETVDVTPFSLNSRDRTIVPEHAQRFYRVLCAVNGAFEEFRSSFFGRSGVQFWWGSFDLNVLQFTGRRVPPPENRGYILRYDLDAEQMDAGFWPGDDSSPEATFFAYLVPQPPGCAVAPIQPAPASWAESMGEWMLPYEHVRTSENPRQAILDFLHSVYRFAVTSGGWDDDAHRYVAPPKPRSGA